MDLNNEDLDLALQFGLGLGLGLAVWTWTWTCYLGICIKPDKLNVGLYCLNEILFVVTVLSDCILQANQTILGVMAVDLMVSEFTSAIPLQQVTVSLVIFIILQHLL